METPVLIALISSCGSVLAALASAIAVFFTWRNTRPRITIQLANGQSRGYFSDGEHNFAFFAFQAKNGSPQAGVISDIVIEYNGETFHAEDTSMEYDLSSIGMTISGGKDGSIPIKTNSVRLKCPISVGGYATVFGAVFFPALPVIGGDFRAVVRFRYAYRNLRRRRFKIDFPFIRKK